MKDIEERMEAPPKLYRISQTQLSIARHYGGCIFQGNNYVYNTKDDTLTREDIWKEEHKKKKEVKKAKKLLSKRKQNDLTL